MAAILDSYSQETSVCSWLIDLSLRPLDDAPPSSRARPRSEPFRWACSGHDRAPRVASQACLGWSRKPFDWEKDHRLHLQMSLLWSSPFEIILFFNCSVSRWCRCHPWKKGPFLSFIIKSGASTWLFIKLKYAQEPYSKNRYQACSFNVYSLDLACWQSQTAF